MTSGGKNRLLWFLLQNASLILFVAVFGFFTAQRPVFLSIENLVNILIQASSMGIAAIGMTFVLLTAGIDLSVGAIMFLSAAIAGKLILGEYPIPLAFVAILVVGLLFGALNGLFITQVGMIPFVVTLATLFAGRGLSLLITQTRAMNLPDLVHIGSAQIVIVRISPERALGIPVPILIFAVVLLVAHVTLTRTAFGRHIYAIGNDLEAAKKAGINTSRVLFCVYLISGLCAAIGGIVLLSQLGAVSPTFGYQREFEAIAAAVLGGTSLFGGKGKVFPGTVLGAILIRAVENGLNTINANEYIYPLVTSFVIFLAVFTDSVRHSYLQQLKRRKIRVEAAQSGL